MHAKSIAKCSKTSIKLSFVIKIFVLSIFEWPFYTGFTVFSYSENSYLKTVELDSTCIELSQK